MQRSVSPVEQAEAVRRFGVNDNILFYTEFIFDLIANKRFDAAGDLADHYFRVIKSKLEDVPDTGYRKALSTVCGYMHDIANGKIPTTDMIHAKSALKILQPYIADENKKLKDTYNV